MSIKLQPKPLSLPRDAQMRKCYWGCLWREEHKEKTCFLRERDQEYFVPVQSFPCWWFLQGAPKGRFLTHLMSSSVAKRYSLCWPTVLCAEVISHQLSISKGSLTILKHDWEVSSTTKLGTVTRFPIAASASSKKGLWLSQPGSSLQTLS